MRILTKDKDANNASILQKGLLSNYGLLADLISDDQLDEISERMLKESEKQ